MGNKIAVYIPNYNGQEFLKRVRIPENLACVVMDNCSTDASEEVSKERGFLFIKNDVFVSRVENWHRCVCHFRQSAFEWMKWLFVGDILYPEAEEVLRRGITQYPEASEIIFNYEIVLANGKRSAWSLPGEWEGYWEYPKLLERMLQEGNVFGSPIGVLISQKANFEELVIEDMEWSSDVSLCLALAKGYKVAYHKEAVGAFMASERKYYTQKRKAYLSALEDLEIQRRVVREAQTYGYDTEQLARPLILSRMRLCLEDNSVGLGEIWRFQKAVFRCMAKRLKDRLGGKT